MERCELHKQIIENTDEVALRAFYKLFMRRRKGNVVRMIVVKLV